MLRAHRHRHKRADEAIVDRLAAALQQVAEAARDDGQHDVVDGAAERLADRLDVGEPAPRPVPAAVRANRAVERRGRRRP